MMLSKIVRNAPCGCGWQRRHLLLGDARAPRRPARGDRVPALDRREHAAAAADVRADERLAPGAGAVGEVVALAVHAVERVGRARQADGVDVGEPELRRVEGGLRRPGRRAPCRSPGPGGRTGSCRRRSPRRGGPSSGRPQDRDGRAGARDASPGLDDGGAGLARAQPLDGAERRARGRSPRGGGPRRARRPSGSPGPGRVAASPSASRCCSCLYANVSSTSARSTSAGASPACAYAPSAARSVATARVPVAALDRRRVLVPADAVDPDRRRPARVLRRPARPRRSRRRSARPGRAVSGSNRGVGSGRRLRVGRAAVRARVLAVAGPRPRRSPRRCARSRAGSGASRGPRARARARRAGGSAPDPSRTRRRGRA